MLFEEWLINNRPKPGFPEKVAELFKQKNYNKYEQQNFTSTLYEIP